MAAENTWKINLDGFDNLLSKLERIPNQSEDVINKTLQNQSGKTAFREIDHGTPISKKELSRTHKKHARGSDAYKIVYTNLGFLIRPKKKFEYIKYPNLGIGTSQHNSPRIFMENGLTRSLSKIQQQIMNAVDQIL
ncbi:hypothetical protein LABALGNA3A7_09770 [Dellaglioa algida]|nr:hypothetical protein LABALGNA3A7_09770 [Dellaglioa algida]